MASYRDRPSQRKPGTTLRLITNITFIIDLQHWIGVNPKTAIRILRIVLEIARDPRTGIGKPEPLKHFAPSIGRGGWMTSIAWFTGSIRHTSSSFPRGTTTSEMDERSPSASLSRERGFSTPASMPSRRARPMAGTSTMRNLGLRRARLRRRWRDYMAYYLSIPANASTIAEARAQLDYWRELTGTPPFDPSYADGEAP